MTCIVGVEHNGKVIIGGDSAGTDSWGRQHVRADEKVFKVGEFAYGFCGSFRAGQLLRFRVEPPAFNEGQSLYEYLATNFVDELRNRLGLGGTRRVENGVESQGSAFLVGARGQLFMVMGDFQVGRTVDGYAAVGSGQEVAVGALHATAGLRMTPRRRLTLALDAAAYFDSAVAPPFNFVEVG